METDKQSNSKSDVCLYFDNENAKAMKFSSHKYDVDKINAKDITCAKKESSLISNEMTENMGERGFQKIKSSAHAMDSTGNHMQFMQAKSSTTLSSTSPKMGSRRIFTPQFKLQVLESYRNDNDCKGNQRATARKYNIHRRQIQKWLQCESNLRSSVANINQNNVKHQFHNISHQQNFHPQLPQHTSLASAIIAPANNNAYLRHRAHYHSHVSLEGESTGVNVSQHVMSAAVVAAAAAGAAEALSIANKSSNISVGATLSPVRPTAIGGTASKTLSSTILHPHHHYTIPYSRTPASAVSMPILSQHLHHHHHHHHDNYQYHNIPPHMHSTLAQTQQNTSTYLPSACLPVTTSMNAASNNLHSFETLFNKAIENCDQNIQNEKLHELSRSSIPETYYRNDESYTHTDCIAPYTRFSPVLSFGGNVTVPMDLSVNSRRISKESLILKDNETHQTQVESQQHKSDNETGITVGFRKRKVYSPLYIQSESPEKLVKINENKSAFDVKNVKNSETDVLKPNDVQVEEDVDVEIEEKIPPIKPIKLFKPYLLDEEKEEYTKESAIDCKVDSNENSKSCPADAMTWKRDGLDLSPPDLDSRNENSNSNSFQTQVRDKFAYSSKSPSFQDTNNEIIAISPASNSFNLSPTSFRCPKGSPVSGYESSSSTCSESNESFLSTETGNYTFQINMQSIYKEHIVAENREQVQKWLDQGTITSHRPPAKSSILYMIA